MKNISIVAPTVKPLAGDLVTRRLAAVALAIPSATRFRARAVDGRQVFVWQVILRVGAERHVTTVLQHYYSAAHVTSPRGGSFKPPPLSIVGAFCPPLKSPQNPPTLEGEVPPKPPHLTKGGLRPKTRPLL